MCALCILAIGLVAFAGPAPDRRLDELISYLILVAGAFLCGIVPIVRMLQLGFPHHRSEAKVEDFWFYCWHVPVSFDELTFILFKILGVQYVVQLPLLLGLTIWVSLIRQCPMDRALMLTLKASWIGVNAAYCLSILLFPMALATFRRGTAAPLEGVMVGMVGMVGMAGALLTVATAMLGFAFFLACAAGLFLDSWWQVLLGFVGLPVCSWAMWAGRRRAIYDHKVEWALWSDRDKLKRRR